MPKPSHGKRVFVEEKRSEDKQMRHNGRRGGGDDIMGF